MNNLKKLLGVIKQSPESIQFEEVIETINDYYDYTPTRFTNGSGDNKVTNEACTNEGSATRTLPLRSGPCRPHTRYTVFLQRHRRVRPRTRDGS